MRTEKLISAAMAAAVFATSVMASGCNKRNDEGTDKFVSADDPWYTVKKVMVGERFADDTEVDYMNVEFAGMTDGKMIFSLTGQYYTPVGKEVSWDELSFGFIDVYSAGGDYERTIDINKLFKEADLYKPTEEEMEKYREGYRKMIGDPNADYEFEASWMIDSGVKLKDGNVVFTASAYIPTYDFMDYYPVVEELTVDLNSGELLSHGLSESRNNSDFSYYDGTYNFEGYTVETAIKYSMEADYHGIIITDPEGNQNVILLENALPDVAVNYVYGMMYLGDDKAIVSITNMEYSNLYYELDLKTGSLKQYLQDVSRIENEFWNTTYVNGTGNIIIDTEGVKTVNVRENKVETILSFDECNINRSATAYMQLLTIDGDTMYLNGMFDYQSQYYSSGGKNLMPLYILTKEKSNPNAGKKILSVASLDRLSYAAYDAICTYNDTNEEYFLKLDDTYSLMKKISSGEMSYSDDDFEEKSNKALSDLSYQLMADLASGDGPDIVMDTASIPHLNKGDIFIDLKKEIGTTGLFSNIVKASEKNGKIYNFPIAVNVEGILAKKSDVGNKQTGFTYEQYKEFVSGPCNGKDPLECGKNEFLTICMSGTYEDYIKDNKADFDNDEFKELAEYINENVNEPMDIDEFKVIDAVESGSFSPTYETFLSFPYVMYRYSDNISNLTVLGLPSKDGRGPDISISCSAAVSANSKETTACIEFIKTLLSDEIQNDFVYRDGVVPVKKAAYEDSANAAVEKYNALFEKASEIYSPTELVDYGFPWHSVDKSAVKDFENMLESCKEVSSNDPGITMILNEEMPAYFTGQKTLDEVISVINNRVNTYLSERG